MFSFLRKNPVKKLEKQYLLLMEEARDLQRSGDLRAYAQKLDEAEALQDKIANLKAAQKEK